jgi:hypothetical protein
MEERGEGAACAGGGGRAVAGEETRAPAHGARPSRLAGWPPPPRGGAALGEGGQRRGAAGRGGGGAGRPPTRGGAAGGGEGRKRGPCNNGGFSQGKKILAGAEEKSRVRTRWKFGSNSDFTIYKIRKSLEIHISCLKYYRCFKNFRKIPRNVLAPNKLKKHT